MKRIKIVSTGGTIANTVDERISVDQVLDYLRENHPDEYARIDADLDVEEVLRRGAETFGPADWRTIARAVAVAAEQSDIDGIVVTHGTFTAEVTAYFLHLTISTEKPIVVVCAQRKHRTVSNDGDRNLLDSIQLAGDPAAGGKGVLVLLNEEIHSAREVTKTSRRPSGFHSDHSGILGTVSEDQVTFYRSPTRRHTADSEFSIPRDSLPRVDIVATYAGADGAAVEGVLSAGAKGLIVNGFSYSGKPHPDQLPSLQGAVAAGVPVVLVNRGGDGRMPVPEEDDGFVRGDNLTAQKARVLLSLALANDATNSDLHRIFAQY